MPIENQGWELLVNRVGLQKSGAKTRTYGSYQVFRDGNPVASLSGFMCETIGPGDNAVENNGRRIAQGRYPLYTQFGWYRSIGYSLDTQVEGQPPMPAVLLLDTGNRTGILVHPAHPPHLYLSSVGCFNPSSPLHADQPMNFWESRARVIALINDLRLFAPTAFEQEEITRIPKAWVVVDGEPMDELPDEPGPAEAIVVAAAAEPPVPSRTT